MPHTRSIILGVAQPQQEKLDVVVRWKPCLASQRSSEVISQRFPKVFSNLAHTGATVLGHCFRLGSQLSLMAWVVQTAAHMTRQTMVIAGMDRFGACIVEYWMCRGTDIARHMTWEMRRKAIIN